MISKFKALAGSVYHFAHGLLGKIESIWDRKWNRDYSQFGETQLVRRLLGEPRSGFFVEVGANDGMTKSTTYGLMLDGWSGVCVEPARRTFERLQKAVGRFEKIKALHCACSPTHGPVKLFHAKNDPNGLSATISTEDDPWFQKIRGTEFEVVDGKPLTVILQETQAPSRFEFLLVDAEGMDYEILQTMDFAAYRPKVIVTEKYPPKDPAKFALLDAAGYKLHTRIGCNTVWVDSQNS